MLGERKIAEFNARHHEIRLEVLYFMCSCPSLLYTLQSFKKGEYCERSDCDAKERE